jgi:MFS family permease
MNKLKYFISTLGGFQFGYAIGIMAGAILFIAPQFSLTPELQGLVVSSFLWGTLPGAAVAGPLANALGRKRAQQLIALFFLIGALLLFMAGSVPLIITGRIIQGLAAGAVAVVGPMYLAEISPAERRGFFIGCYQLSVTLGIFVAYGVNYLLSGTGNWHLMLGLAAIPAVAHLLGFFSMPESSHQAEIKTSWKALFDPSIRSVLIIALLLNVFQQITGVNAILYFAPSIFQAAGFATPAMALLPPLLMGVINFIMTILATFLMDRWGRRPLLSYGVAGMTLALLGLVTAFLTGGTTMKWLATSSIMIFVASFAIGMGPIPQLIGAELFPRRVRGQGMSLTMLINWFCNFLVVFSFMDFASRLSHAGTFAIYAFFGILAFYFIRKYIPETKGQKLD